MELHSLPIIVIDERFVCQSTMEWKLSRPNQLQQNFLEDERNAQAGLDVLKAMS